MQGSTRTGVWLATALFVATVSTTTQAQTELLGGIGRGSLVNPGFLIQIDQGTGIGTLIGKPDSIPGLTGLAFGGSALYGTTISGSLFTGRFSQLVQIDPITGAEIGSAVDVTETGSKIPINDLAMQPGTNILYGTNVRESDFTNDIYTIDTATGVATVVGNTGLIGATIAFAADGTLYMTSAEFDASGNFLQGFLNTVDPSTAAVLTTSAPFTAHHVGGLAVRPWDGAIFASGGDEGDIYRLSTGGTETLIGLTGVGGVGDLAFVAVPEPSALAVLVLGVPLTLAFAFRRRRM